MMPAKIPDAYHPPPEQRPASLLKKAYERLIKIRGQPREIAQGFALGIFVGMSPFLGFQTMGVIFLASLLKWNKIAAAIGVWISNPVTAPVLYSVTYFIGAAFMGKDPAPLPWRGSPESFLESLARAPDILWALVLGGMILGLPLAVASYYFVHSAVRRYQVEIREKLARKKRTGGSRLRRRKKRPEGK